MNPIDVGVLLSTSNQLQRRGVRYLYGGKADDRQANPRSTGRLGTPIDTIDGLDCSGFIRYVLFRASGTAIPDGSQAQLEWFQENAGGDEIRNYSDVNAAEKVLYIAFIKPHTNGCGEIGHVWFVYKQSQDAPAETLESHGGVGVDSRPWNTMVLQREEFLAFKLPVTNT